MEIPFNKKKKFAILATALTIIICFIIAETGIRIYHVTSDRQRFIWLPDEFMGYIHSNNNTFKHHYTEQTRITVEHKTNEFGLMGNPVSIKKEPDVFRILMLGDSYTEAIQVPGSKNFCSRLQTKFNSLPDQQYKNIEVLNAGVSGYSPLNYYLNYKRAWHELNPDLVMVQLFANDVFEDNTARAKSILDENGLPLKTGRYFEQVYFDYPLVSEDEFNTNPLGYRLRKALMEWSRFFEYMYVKIYNVKKKSKFNQKMIREDQYGTGYQFYILDPEHVLSRDEEFLQRTWGYTKKYLLALKEEVEKNNSRFMMFYMPMEVQLDLPRHGEHARLYVFKKQGRIFNNLLAEFAREHNIRYVDLLDDFEKQKNNGLYLNKDGHLTTAGHKVASDTLFRKITGDKRLVRSLRLD